MWSIACLENTLKISKKCAKDLCIAKDETEYTYDEESYRDSDGLIVFNSDDMEHQDFLWREDILKVLKKHKVNGKVLWGSLDGDNFGKFWGYEFKNGVMNELTGSLNWTKSK